MIAWTMSYMAMLTTHHPLYATQACASPSFRSFPLCHGRQRFSWWRELPASAPSLSSATCSALGYCGSETGELDYGGSETGVSTIKHIEALELSNKNSLAQSLCVGLLLQWTLALETRRSFITGPLQRLFNRVLDCCSSHLSPPQPGTTARRGTFARRVAMMIPFLIPASTSCNILAEPSPAKAARNVGSSFFQNFGIGERDIYYPRIFEGSWVCSSTLVAVDTPQGDEKADLRSVEFSRKQLGYTVTYKARFIPFEKYVIGDRLFTTLSLVESTVGSNVVDHGIWSPQKPDRLTLVLRGGLKVQNIVTRRSATLSGPGQFDTSEYSQQVFDNNKLEGGPPTIKASQNRTRYRWDTVNNEEVSYIEAFQRVSMFPVVQEEFKNMDLMNLDKPVTVYKYIVKFRRDES